MADFQHIAPLTIEFPTNPVYRIARRDHVLTGSKIRPQDSLSQAGHRFDLLSGRVIYCATQLQGSFAEVLSPFRQAPSSRNLVDYAVDSEYMNQGNLPANWRELRSILRITSVEPLPFLELENPKTLAYLDVMLATQLREFGVYSPLDISLAWATGNVGRSLRKPILRLLKLEKLKFLIRTCKLLLLFIT